MAATGVIMLESPVRDSLVGLVVKGSASRAEDPEFYARLRRDFPGSSHTGDLKLALRPDGRVSVYRDQVR